jgi:hypothetical protein
MLAPASAPKAGPWRGVVFAMFGLILVSGGVLAYLLMPGARLPRLGGGDVVAVREVPTDSPPKPIAEPYKPGADDGKPLSAPVIPVQPADPAKAGTKVAMLSAKDTKSAGPGKGAPSGAAGAARPEAATATTPTTARTKQAADAEQSEHPATAPPTPASPKTSSQTTKAGAVPILPSRQAPKTWQVVMPEPAHGPATPNPAGAPTSPAPHEPAATPPTGSPRPVRPTPPAPSTLGAQDAAAHQAAADAEAVLTEARTAFSRGDRQAAITTALALAQRGGPEAVKAWRFVGGAACSIRSAAMATNAYHNLKEPEHKRLLVELCQRNGLHFNDGTFSTEE